jgi:hypothetical protein
MVILANVGISAHLLSANALMCYGLLVRRSTPHPVQCVLACSIHESDLRLKRQLAYQDVSVSLEPAAASLLIC